MKADRNRAGGRNELGYGYGYGSVGLHVAFGVWKGAGSIAVACVQGGRRTKPGSWGHSRY